MKKASPGSICICYAFASLGIAQRYAVVDTKYILIKCLNIHDAQKKLDQISEQWQKEIDDKQETLSKNV